MNFSRSLRRRHARRQKSMFRRYHSDACYYSNSSMVPGISKVNAENDLDKLVRWVECGWSLNVFDCDGNGLLHIAVEKNNASMLDYLLSLNTELINERNFLGETALFKAIAEERFQLAEKLILAGADVNIRSKSDQTPLHLAVCVPKIAHLLITPGANLDCTDTFGQTPLHDAVDFRQLETACMLLYYNANPNIPNNRNSTPFMIAVEKRCLEMQEVLFEYVDDYDVIICQNNFSVLGLALVNDCPFTEEMIMRGADVNNMTSSINGAFFIILHYARITSPIYVKIFELIWEGMNYQAVEEMSVLGRLFMLDRRVFHGIVDVFINSHNFSVVAESVSHVDDFIVKCIEHRLPFVKFSTLFNQLLSYGYTPSENDLSAMFNYWGYCEPFKIALHMEIRPKNTYSIDKIPTRLISDVKLSTKDLLDNLVTMIREEKYSLDVYMAMVVFRTLDHCVYPPLIKAYTEIQNTDCVTFKMNALPKVPSLMELARNQTREHIKKSYNVTNSCQLQTLINNLDIGNTYKKILTFESILYRPTFTEGEFRKYRFGNCGSLQRK